MSEIIDEPIEGAVNSRKDDVREGSAQETSGLGSAVFSYPIQIRILPLHFRTQGSSGYPCDDARSTKFGAPSE